MSFLSKHYEKIVLASFLLIFIVALVYLITVFSKSTEITEKDLILVQREPDYQRKFSESGDENAEEGKKQYAHLKNLSKSQSWNKSVNRNPNSPVATDLLIPIQAARCPKCHKIIPSIYFEKKEKCILCGSKLEKLKKVEVDQSGKDSDNDGMPDIFEAQNGLNPQLASDKMEDKDEDGYPNFIEFKAKTKIGDPLSHPPLAERLALVKIKKNRIPLLLYNVMRNGSEDKTKWLAQIKIRDRRGRWKSEFKKIGQTLKLGKDIFKITDINFKEKEQFDKRLRQPVKKNVSEITILNTLNEKDGPVIVSIKKVAYENMKKIYIQDMVSEKRFILQVGDTFTDGNEIIGTQKYKVISANEKKEKDGSKNEFVVIQTVTKDGKPGKEFEIKKKSALNTQIEEITGQEATKPERNMIDPMMDPMMMPPGTKKTRPGFNRE